MTPYKCSRCKITIPYKYGKCSSCREIEFQEMIDKQVRRSQAKYRNTLGYGVSTVKQYADGKFWCTTHVNCFRATISVDEKTGKWKGESEEHVDKQFERWKHHRKLGRSVYCNLRLKEGLGRPDLVIVDNGHIFIEEIVHSENEASLKAKKSKYPWPIITIKC